jgi:hypothetical protein
MIPRPREANIPDLYGWRLQQINYGQGPTISEPVACQKADSLVTSQQCVCTFGNQQHFAYVDVRGDVWDCFYDGGDTWTVLQINGGDLGAPPSGRYNIAPVLYAFGNQLHFVYIDTNSNLQDCFVDGPPIGSPSPSQWQLRQINGPKPLTASEALVCPRAPTVGQGSLEASLWPGFVYSIGDQLHFTYIDEQFNVQDCYYDGDPTPPWPMRQINNSEGLGPTVTGSPAESVACPEATASASSMFVCTFGDQQHFAYVDGANNLWDVYSDGNAWKVLKINNGEVPTAQPAPSLIEGGDVFLCTYGDTLHFTYIDHNNNLQDCIYDGDQWTLQQINGGQPTVQGEPVCFPDAPPVNTAVSVWSACPFGDQLHFIYVDDNYNLQDCWYGWRPYGNGLPGGQHLWDVVQLTGKGGVYPDAPPFGDDGTLFVSVYGTQLHVTYTDNRFNLQDIYWVSYPGEIGLTGGNVERFPVPQGLATSG